jgi:hypothetical protein
MRPNPHGASCERGRALRALPLAVDIEQLRWMHMRAVVEPCGAYNDLHKEAVLTSYFPLQNTTSATSARHQHEIERRQHHRVSKTGQYRSGTIGMTHH